MAAANAALATSTPLNGAAPPEQLAAIGVTAPKLFVGQIPRAMKEEAARAMFEPYGKIFDFALMYDRATGQSRGSAFLTFYKKESADKAMATLHQKITLPGVRCVSPACGLCCGSVADVVVVLLPDGCSVVCEAG